MCVDPSATRPQSLTWNNLHFNEGRCLHSPRGSRGLRPLFPRILVSIYLYQSLISPFTPLKRKSKPLGEAIYQETPRNLLSSNRGWSCSTAPLTLDFEDGSKNGSKVKVAGLRIGKSELRPFISLPTFWLRVITVCLDLDGQRVERASGHSYQPLPSFGISVALGSCLRSRTTHGFHEARFQWSSAAGSPVKGISGLG